jgi:glyoxylase-like metal-dependent hydrolase (beta-lactamase superfamily II)
MNEILPGIFTWAYESPEKKINFNGWYLATPDEPILVDPPACSDKTMDEIEQRGTPRAVILTNKDHFRKSEEFASIFRAPILIHQADAPLVSVRIGGVFKHGDDLPGGVHAIRIPDAKSPGETAFLIRRANAVLLGDALVGRPPGQLNLLPADKFADISKAREGIRILLKYSFDGVLVGDGESIPKGGREAIEDFLARAN